jgi:hypothetical protein
LHDGLPQLFVLVCKCLRLAAYERQLVHAGEDLFIIRILKALSVGAKACSGGRFYLYALAAAGQAGVERTLKNLHAEIERDMKLMGCRSIDQLSRRNLRFR